MADVLTYLKGLKPRNLIGASFGSYGWSGESAGQIRDILEGMKVVLAGEPIKSKYVPDDAVLEKCYAVGRTIAEKLREDAVNE